MATEAQVSGRDRILDAAVRLFALVGVDSVSVADVACEVPMTELRVGRTVGRMPTAISAHSADGSFRNRNLHLAQARGGACPGASASSVCAPYIRGGNSAQPSELRYLARLPDRLLSAVFTLDGSNEALITDCTDQDVAATEGIDPT